MAADGVQLLLAPQEADQKAAWLDALCVMPRVFSAPLGDAVPAFFLDIIVRRALPASRAPLTAAGRAARARAAR